MAIKEKSVLLSLPSPKSTLRIPRGTTFLFSFFLASLFSCALLRAVSGPFPLLKNDSSFAVMPWSVIFYLQVVTISLRCVSWLVKFPLPSLNKHVPTMGKLLFNILKNYAKAGAKVGENFEMLISAFKVRMRVLSFRILFKENVLSGNFSTRRVGWNTGMAW